jgi:hypothetical protein
MKEVYREALRLHKISWQKIVEGKAKYFWQRDTFDDSHLPKLMSNDSHLQFLDWKISSSNTPDNYKENKFEVTLSPEDALILLLKHNYDNINYHNEFDIDLENYQLGAETYKITIK